MQNTLRVLRSHASSPIGKGLMGKVVNDVVDITVPNGIIKFKILNISI